MLASPELSQEPFKPGGLAGDLSRYALQIPLYQRMKRAPGSDGVVSGDLSRWPLITKADIRRGFPDNFLSPGSSLDDLLDQDLVELEHTSGTSEERTALILPRGWWGDQELRALRLNSSVATILRHNPEARRATINSPVCSGDVRYNGVPSRNDRIVGNTLFVSLSRYPFLWSERELQRIADEILEWKPDFLDIDPVYGVVFALYCERRHIHLPTLRFVICSYEFVSIIHRSILSRVFRVPVLDLYGSTETGHLLMEDDQGEMRASRQTAFLEVIQEDDFGVGDLVVTTLTNPFMPLIRYSIGDLVARSEGPYGMRYVLHGRTADSFRISSNDRVTTRQVDQCFLGVEGLGHYQLIQRKGEGWILRYVPDVVGPDPGRMVELQDKLSHLLRASPDVILQKTDMLVPESSGKFRLGYPERSVSPRAD
jgi:phenylacetate-coenzyme A ligase PaaK-like adenylate-forming protein